MGRRVRTLIHIAKALSFANYLIVFARNEVVVCAGAFDSPKILLLSGIGPTEELVSLEIDAKHDLPRVGKHLLDHYGTWVIAEMDGEFSDRRFRDQQTANLRPLRDQWLDDKTGYYRNQDNSIVMAFLHDKNLLETKEFASLDMSQQEHLRNPEVPAYEIVAVRLDLLTTLIYKYSR
jgi:choline dehydrogenase-like flavoprotein